VTYFDDPRSREAERVAFEAEQLWRRGERADALANFARAAQLEETLALELPKGSPRLRGLAAESAVALWLKAENFSNAATLACRFLGDQDGLTPQGRATLRELTQRAWRDAELVPAFGPNVDAAPLEVKLRGGLVHEGLAPQAVVRDTIQVVIALVVRATEWLAKLPFRRAHEQSRVQRQLRFFEAAAVAGSYAPRLYVVSGSLQRREQATIAAALARPGLAEGDRLPAATVVDNFLELSALAAEGPLALAAKVRERDYFEAFKIGFRELAPTGRGCESMELRAPASYATSTVVTLSRDARRALTDRSQSDGDQAPESKALTGILKMVNLRSKQPRVGLESTDGKGAFTSLVLPRMKFDDTIGPKVNRQVRVTGRAKVSGAGRQVFVVSDIELIEGE